MGDIEKKVAEVIELLKSAQQSDDTERAHAEADDALCDLLSELGYAHVVAEFAKVRKWYA
jgi:hypothetical protein